MTVKVTKPALNLREELSSLKKPSGVAGEAMLRADTPQEQFNLIGAGRKNLIINGAMQVAQRGTSFTNIGSNTYQLDRFGVYKNEGTLNVAQSTDAPAGFNNSLLVTVATAGAIDTTSVLGIFQNIEGYTATGLQWDGKGDPQQATASFYIKSSVAGKYSFRIRLGGVGTFVKSFTIDTANVWEYKTVTIPASPYTVPNTTNGNAMTVGISFGAGSNYHAVDGVWGTSDEYGVAGQADFIGTTNASLYLTGVQLELGSVATPFEHRSYGEELALCERYYQQSYDAGTAEATATTIGAFHYRTGATSSQYETMVFTTQMRAAPTIRLYGTTSATNTVGYWRGSSDVAYAVGLPYISTGRFSVSFNTAENIFISGHWIADAEL